MRTKTFALLLAPLLLAGCGVHAAPADTLPTTETTAETAAEPTPEPAPAGFSEVGTLSYIPYTTGGYWGWNTGDAYYEIARASNDGWDMAGLILKTDYATGQQAPLCNVPGCTHDSTACPAYLETWERTNLLVLDGKVYLYYAGNDYWNYDTGESRNWQDHVDEWRAQYQEYAYAWDYASEEEYIESCRIDFEKYYAPSSIEMLNDDLTERTTILTFTDDMRDLTSLYFGYCDQNALYAADSSIQKNTPGRSVRLDIHTGEVQEIQLYANEEVVDAKGGRFLTQRIVSDAPMPSCDDGDIYRAALQNARYEFDWLDPQTLEREKICDMPTTDSPYFVREYKDRVYVEDNMREVSDWGTQCSFAYYDKSNTRTELVADLPVNAYMPQTDSGFMPVFGSEERSWIWVEKSGADIWSDVDYLYNLDTGEAVQITQKQYRDGGNMAVSVMAQTSDGRWLIGYKPHSNTHNDRCDYGLIDPQDFMNGSEDYTLVQMWD